MTITKERALDVATSAGAEINAALEDQDALVLLLRADGSYSIEDAGNARLILEASRSTVIPFIAALPALDNEEPQELSERIYAALTAATSEAQRNERILQFAMTYLTANLETEAQWISKGYIVTADDVKAAFANIGITENAAVERPEPVFKDALVSLTARVEVPSSSAPLRDERHRVVGFTFKGEEYVFGLNIARNGALLTLDNARECFKAIGDVEIKYQSIT